MVVAVLIALTVMAVVTRAGRLGPNSLWHDDAWVALVSRTHGLRESLLPGVTAPGFVLMVKGWLRLFGFSETASQTLPFLAGIAGPGLLYLVGLRRGLAPMAALLGAILLLTAPTHVEFSSAVKQYSLEAIGATILIGMAWILVQDPDRPSAWRGYVITAALCIVFSAILAVVAWGGVAGGLVAALRKHRRISRELIVTVGALGLFCLGFWFLYLREGISPALTDYWKDYYIPLDQGRRAIVSATGQGLLRLVGGFSTGEVLIFVGGLATAATYVAIRRPALGVLLLSPIVLAVILATLERAPLGGRRVDIYLYPCLCLLVAVAAHDVIVRFSRIGLALCGSVGVVLLAFAPVMKAGDYPRQEIKPLVAQLERSVRPGDATLVYPGARFTVPLYSRWPIEFKRDASVWQGYTVVLRHPGVVILPQYRWAPEKYRPIIAALARRYERLWLIAANTAGDIQVLKAYLEEYGFLPTASRYERPGASLTMWEKGDPG